MVKGSIVAIVTPMYPDGSLDKQGFETLLKFHINSGTDAIVVAGTTGESATLSEEEHAELVSTAISYCGGQLPIIAGTGTNSTAKTIKLSQQAKDLGADASLIVTPYYNKPTQEGLYAHYSAIAEAVDLPIILYNVPARTACDMLPETIIRLAKVNNIIGCKEATADVSRVQQIKAETGKDFLLYSGDDITAKAFMLAGGDGVISVSANLVPQVMHELCQLALSGEHESANALDQKVAELHQALFLEPNPIPVKWALSEMKLIQEGIRLPLLPLSTEHQKTMHDVLSRVGIQLGV